MENLKKTFSFIIVFAIFLISSAQVFATETTDPTKEINIPITLKVKNEPTSKQDFKFKISSITENAPLPTDTDITINGSGTESLIFNSNDYKIYEYNIEQDLEPINHYKLDRSKYIVKVYLSNDNNPTVISYKYKEDGTVEDEKSRIVFENEYINPNPNPPTPYPPRPTPDSEPYEPTPGPSPIYPNPSPDPTPTPLTPTVTNWTITLKDGTKIQQNGDIIRPDGTKITQNRAIYNTAGIKFEVAVNSSGVKFVNNRAPGEVKYSKYVDNTTGKKFNLMTDTVTGVKYILNVDASGIKFESSVLPFKMELTDGTRIMPDGEVKLTDGTSIASDNSVKLNDGTTIDPERNITLANGDILEVGDAEEVVFGDNVVLEKSVTTDPLYNPTIRTSGALTVTDEPENLKTLNFTVGVLIISILVILFKIRKEDEEMI